MTARGDVIREGRHIYTSTNWGKVYSVGYLFRTTYSGRYPFSIPVIPVHFFVSKDRYLLLLEKAILDRKEKIGRYPKAIVPVALYGMPYHIDKILAIAEKYGIPVVEDAAEGMGSRFNGQVL